MSLKTYTPDELKEILRLHKLWLDNDKNGIRANLSRADLSRANLSRADLSGADLSGANLSRANLSWADLSRADLSMFNILSNGTLEVYKKIRDNLIAVLEIPKKAKRVNAYGSRKCRAEYAKVIKIENQDGEKVKEGFGLHDEKFKYVVGKTVKPDSFDPDPRVECSKGIHFFITKEEARNYND